MIKATFILKMLPWLLVCSPVPFGSDFTNSTRIFSGVWRTFTSGQHATVTAGGMAIAWINAVSAILGSLGQTAMPAAL